MTGNRGFNYGLLAVLILLAHDLPVVAQDWTGVNHPSRATHWVASLSSAPVSVMVRPDPPSEALPEASSEDASQSVEDETLAPLVEGVTQGEVDSHYQLLPSGYHPYSPRFCRPTRVYRSYFLGRLWYNAELLAWATKGQDLPVLVTNSPAVNPNTILFGNQRVHDDLRLGGRITSGWWWTPEQHSGFELQYFGVDGEDIDYRAGSGISAIIARPFINEATGPDAATVNAPGVANGTIGVRADMEFTGAGAHLRHRIADGPFCRIDWLLGYRYLRLYDQLRTLENFTSLSPASGFATGLDVERLDRFRTENEFHGGELGIAAQWRRHCWSVDFLGKAAYGASHQGLFVQGQTTTIDRSGAEPVTTVYNGGLLGQQSNSGSLTATQDSFVGELGIALKYHINCQTRLAIGYTAIYWDDVSRSADQLDLTVSPAQIPPAGGVGGRPTAVMLNETDFWAHGLTASFEYQF